MKPRIFKGLNRLRILSLHTNRITILPNGIFHELPNIQDLNLSVNELRTINKCAFRDVRRLGTIEVRGNPIMCTCSLQWTTAVMGPLIVGMCYGPSQLEGDDIRTQVNYQGCQQRNDPCPRLPAHRP